MADLTKQGHVLHGLSSHAVNLPDTSIPGLVWAQAFTASDGWRNVVAEDNWSLEQVMAAGEFFWLHLSLRDIRVGHVLERLPQMTPEILQSLTSRDIHSSLVYSPEMVCGTMVDFQREFDHDTAELGWMHFAVNERFLVTTRLHPLSSIERARRIVSKDGRVRSPMDVLSVIVMEFQRTIMQAVHQTNEDLNEIEDHVFQELRRDDPRKLAEARRVIVRLHRHVRTVLGHFRRLSVADDDDIPKGFDAVARQLSDRLQSVEHDISALQDRARLLHDDIDSKATAETNRNLYIISIFTVFLMPPTLVTGFFGMNTSALPFSGAENGTLFAGLILTLSVLLAFLLLKRYRML